MTNESWKNRKTEPQQVSLTAFFDLPRLQELAFCLQEIVENNGGDGNIQMKIRHGKIASIGMSTERYFTEKDKSE